MPTSNSDRDTVIHGAQKLRRITFQTGTKYFAAVILGICVGASSQPKKYLTLNLDFSSQGNGTISDLYTKYFSEERLARLAKSHRERFLNARPFPHVYIDDFLSRDFVAAVHSEFASTNFGALCEAGYHIASGSKQKKVHCFHKERDENESKKSAVLDESVMGPNTRLAFNLLKSSLFVAFLEQVTGIDDIIPDPHYRGSGLHQTEPGGFLRVHADFNRYERFGLDRRVNVFLFLNHDWDPSWGGALELWPRDMSGCERKIQPIFNRLVIFRTTDFSYHGYTDPIRSPYPRRSVSMYYYTNGRPSHEKIDPSDGAHAHGTLWQKVKCAMQTDSDISPICQGLAN